MEFTFLTRAGCRNSPALYRNLMDALAAQGWPARPTIVDAGELPPHDARTGYGTPTVLVDGADLFGMAAPEPAAPT